MGAGSPTTTHTTGGGGGHPTTTGGGPPPIGGEGVRPEPQRICATATMVSKEICGFPLMRWLDASVSEW